jgi:DNA polymerase-3 subunit epsilon
MESSFFIPKQETAFLHLSRPLVFFDLETTGIDPLRDRIVEIYAVKVYEGGRQEEIHHLVNPTVPIPAGASAVHGITDADVADKPTFAELVEVLADFFRGCDLAGYNIKKYDVPMLVEEFGRCKKYPINFNEVKQVDVMGIYHHKEKRDLSAAVKFYLEKDHAEAHSAKADVQATMAILKRQLLLYDDLEADTDFLHNYLDAGKNVDPHWKFVRDEAGRIVFNFGQHKGVEACTQPKYLKWMIDEGEFATTTKMVANKIYRHCLWEREIKKWLAEQKLLEEMEVAAALYATAKAKEGVNPFSVSREREKLTIAYQSEPPVGYTFVNGDALQILIRLLEERLGE